MSALHRPVRVAELATRRLSDQELVVASPSGTAVVVNEVGAIVLDLCDGSRSIDEIATIVFEALSGATEDAVRSDVHAFVSQLSASGCVVEAP